MVALTTSLPAPARSGVPRRRLVAAYLRRNPQLAVGVGMLVLLALFGVVGPYVVDTAQAAPSSVVDNVPPSAEYPFGTDGQGRNLFAALVVGVPQTLWVGLVAGLIGVGVGTLLGFIAGFFGGFVDNVIRVIVDSLLTIPALLILVSIASTIRGFITVDLIAFVVGSLAWMGPARSIRAQVLSMRERSYVDVARFSGQGRWGIIFRELMPNMLAFLLAGFVSSISAAVLADIGLEVLGLGPQNTPTVGMTIYWSIYYGAIQSGEWWWWGVPSVILAWLFFGLYFASTGLDELANPRRRTS